MKLLGILDPKLEKKFYNFLDFFAFLAGLAYFASRPARKSLFFSFRLLRIRAARSFSEELDPKPSSFPYSSASSAS